MSIERARKVKMVLSPNLASSQKETCVPDGRIFINDTAQPHHAAEQNIVSADALYYSDAVKQSSSEVRTSRRKLGSSRRNKVDLQKGDNSEMHNTIEEVENQRSDASFKSIEMHPNTNEMLLASELICNIVQEDHSNIQRKLQTPEHLSTGNMTILQIDESITEENRGLGEIQIIQHGEVRHEETNQDEVKSPTLKVLNKMSQEELSQLSRHGNYLYLPSIPHQSPHSLTGSPEVNILLPKSEYLLTNDHGKENDKKLEKTIKREIMSIDAIGCILDQSRNTLPKELLPNTEIKCNFKVSEDLFIQSHHAENVHDPLQIEEMHPLHDSSGGSQPSATGSSDVLLGNLTGDNNVDLQEMAQTVVNQQDILNPENKHLNDEQSTTAEEICIGQNPIYKDEDQGNCIKVSSAQDSGIERFPRKIEHNDCYFQTQSDSCVLTGEQTKLSGKRRKMGSTRSKIGNIPNQTFAYEGLKHNELMKEHKETFVCDDMTYLRLAVTSGQHCPSSEEAHHLKEINVLEVSIQDNIAQQKTNEIKQEEENQDICYFTEELKKEESFQPHAMLLCKESSDIQDMSYGTDIIKLRKNTLDDVDNEVSQYQNLKEIVSDENYTVKKQLNERNLAQEEFSSYDSTCRALLPHSIENKNVFAYTWDAVKRSHKEDPPSKLFDLEMLVSEQNKVSNADKVDELPSLSILPKADQNKDEVMEGVLKPKVDMIHKSSVKEELNLRVEPKCNTSDIQDTCDLHEEIEKTEMTQGVTDITSASLLSTQSLSQDPNIPINMGLSEVVSDIHLSIIQMRETDEHKTTEKTTHSISSLPVNNEVTEEAPKENKEVIVHTEFEEKYDTMETEIVQSLPNTTHRPIDQYHEPEPGVSTAEQNRTYKLSGKRRKMGSTHSKLQSVPNQTMTDLEGLNQHDDIDIRNNVCGETSELQTSSGSTAALSKSTSREHTIHNIESTIPETSMFDDKTHLSPAGTVGQHCPSPEDAQHQPKETNALEVSIQDSTVFQGHKANELMPEEDKCLLEIVYNISHKEGRRKMGSTLRSLRGRKNAGPIDHQDEKMEGELNTDTNCEPSFKAALHEELEKREIIQNAISTQTLSKDQNITVNMREFVSDRQPSIIQMHSNSGLLIMTEAPKEKNENEKYHTLQTVILETLPDTTHRLKDLHHEQDPGAMRQLNEIQQTENIEKAFHNELSPAKMRRKLGSTRMSLRPRKENLHTEREDNNEVLEIAKDLEETRLSEPVNQQTQLIQGAAAPEKEALESMMVCESNLKPMAHLPDLESEGTHIDLCYPSESETFSENDTKVPCRRRKMASNRKKQRQDYKDESNCNDKTDDIYANDLKSNTEENNDCQINKQITEVATLYDKNRNQPLNINTDLESWQIPQQVTPITLKDDQKKRKERYPSGHSHLSDPGKCYNVVLVGNSNVGKTCFMRRVQRGEFSTEICSSIGIDTCMKAVTVDGKTVSLCLWDTAGQERFRSITRQIFHKAQVFLLFYDITSSESFSDVRYWLSCIKKGAAEDVIILLIGNKNDCKRQVESAYGESLAKENNIDFMECSAATGENVIMCIETIARLLSKKHAKQEDMMLHKPQMKKSSGCC